MLQTKKNKDYGHLHGVKTVELLLRASSRNYRISNSILTIKLKAKIKKKLKKTYGLAYF